MTDEESPRRSGRGVVVLLSVIAVAVLVIAGLLAYPLIQDRLGEKSAEWKAAEEDARGEAEVYCTLGGVVSGPPLTGLDDPRYEECVDREVEDAMERWEVEHGEE